MTKTFAMCTLLLLLSTLPTTGAASDRCGGGSPSGRRVQYYSGWGIYTRSFYPWEMDLAKLTHVNYAFMNLESTCSVVSGDAWADFDIAHAHVGASGNTGAFVAMRDGSTAAVQSKGLHFPHLKLLLSIGGWTWSKHFSTCLRDTTSRARVVQTAVDLLARTKFDGIDLDWEYPTGCADTSTGGVSCGLAGNSHDPADWQHYLSLIAELRAEIAAREAAGILAARPASGGYLVTAAVGMNPKLNTDFAGAQVLADFARALDFVNLMTYDYHGHWDAYTAHQTPLFPSAALTDAATGSPQGFNIETSAAVWLDALASASPPVPPAKLTLGLASYGRSWGNVQASAAGGPSAPIHGPASGAGPCTPWTGQAGAGCDEGLVLWRDIKQNYYGGGSGNGASGWELFREPDAEAPYVYNPARGELIVFDDPQSIRRKVRWAGGKALGGFMWWEASDDPAHDLLGAMHDEECGGGNNGGGGGDSPTPAPPTPTARPGPGPGPSPTPAPPTPSLGSNNGGSTGCTRQAAAWGQCGGALHSGPTCCPPGHVCVADNAWWSACKPTGSGGSNPNPNPNPNPAPGPVPTPTPAPPSPTPATPSPSPATPGSGSPGQGQKQCRSTGAHAGYTDAWCTTNCNHPNPNCPAAYCTCTGGGTGGGTGPAPAPAPPTPAPPSPTPAGHGQCRSTGAHAGYTDAWCTTNCNWTPPNCPAAYCTCTGGASRFLGARGVVPMIRPTDGIGEQGGAAAGLGGESDSSIWDDVFKRGRDRKLLRGHGKAGY